VSPTATAMQWMREKLEYEAIDGLPPTVDGYMLVQGSCQQALLSVV
jgi:hypothetical protein